MSLAKKAFDALLLRPNEQGGSEPIVPKPSPSIAAQAFEQVAAETARQPEPVDLVAVESLGLEALAGAFVEILRDAPDGLRADVLRHRARAVLEGGGS